MTDPIADYLTRIRNALAAGQNTVRMPSSRMKVELSRLLQEEGYIDGYVVDPAGFGSVLSVELKYASGRHSVISGLKRVSKPGGRTYVKSADIPKVLGGIGTAIISTSQGIISGHDAKRRGVGGEVVAYIW